ncbi:MAG: glycosyl hydrolase [Kiritimatiellia bacterium]
MRKINWVAWVGCLLTLMAVRGVWAEGRPGQTDDRLAAGFERVPDAAKPWCYWWWINGHVDKETITADLEAMKRLGFGGLLMFDSRGYWDDESHVVNPKPETAFMSPEWQDYVVHAIREAARLGLAFTMNMSSSGGKLDGPWDVGVDAPKRLVYKIYPADTAPEAFEAPDLPFYHEIAAQTVWYTGADLVPGDWRNGGDGVYTMSASSGARLDGGSGERPRVLAAAGAPGAKRVVVRFGYTVLPGHEHDVDVLDPRAVTGHYLRFQGELQRKIPDLVGRDRTLTALYSISWEGTMPTWTGDFVAEFRKHTGRDIRPDLPLLAGFERADKAANAAFLRAYRRARNDMFRENFYGTMRDLSHARNLDWFSESGGPWQRGPALFREADQLRYLAVNDLPQGEFWPCARAGRARAAGRFHTRAAVSAAHVYGRPRASAEAFTHMMRHWSVDPAFLKQPGDQAYADGVNHFVWHTFTCSPRKFGVPGAEYFAGSHINRNVTWHRDLEGFVRYLGRCQWMLQQGVPVVDYAVYAGDRPYQHWGRYRDKPYDASKTRLPEGYAYDLVNDEALLTRVMAKDGRLALPNGISYGALVVDPEFPDEPLDPAVTAKIAAFRSAGVPVVAGVEVREASPVKGLLPDFEATPGAPGRPRATAAHRRLAGAGGDIYFVTGDGAFEATFRVAGRAAELWDPVSGARGCVPTTQTPDGRTRIALDLPMDGSVFVVFREKGATTLGPVRRTADLTTLAGPWRVSFRYPAGIAAPPPAPVTMTDLRDFTSFDADELRYFAGTATYRQTVHLTAAEAEAAVGLALGELPSGTARVFVNGVDCGVAWCAPWEVPAKFRAGENEIAVEVTNNWHNRLLGDCFLPEGERVTRSTLRYWNVARTGDERNPWKQRPTVYSGYAVSDPLQPSGLRGPVRILRAR